MLNWRRIVRERLQPSGLKFNEVVVSELASHLQESYDAARSQGVSEQGATEIALQEVEDWHVLAKEIYRARRGEDSMNQRTRSLWLPALATFLGASISLMLCQIWGIRPQLAWMAKLAMPLYWPWLSMLPIFGALGAYLSQRAHGTMGARFAAGFSPALIMLAVMCLILPWGLFIDGFHSFEFVGFAVVAITWVVIPALALGVGALPFLLKEIYYDSMQRGLTSEGRDLRS